MVLHQRLVGMEHQAPHSSMHSPELLEFEDTTLRVWILRGSLWSQELDLGSFWFGIICGFIILC